MEPITTISAVTGVTAMDLEVNLAEKHEDIVTVAAIPIQDEPQVTDISNETATAKKRIVKIRVLDPETEPAQRDFPLSILDAIMPRMLVPVTYTYQLDEAAYPDKDLIVSHVGEALRRLLGEYPIFTGSLHEPQHDSEETVVRRIAALHADFDLHVQDLTSAASEEPSFAQLAEQHFPPSMLECMMPQVVQLGNDVPVMAVQLNFIRGGLVLGIAVHHLLVDARGLDILIARWAAHSRSLFHPALYQPPPPFNPDNLDPSILLRQDATESNSSNTTMPLDYRNKAVDSLVYAPSGLPPPHIPLTSVSQHIWHIPASKLAALKASASVSEANNTEPWVSTNDCITALMWRAITRARLAAHSTLPTDTRPVALENSLDVRGAFPAAIPAAYVGNVVMFSRTELPLADLLAPHTFRKVALATRQAVDKYRSWETVRTAMAWIATCPMPANVEMDFDAIGGLDVVATSWRVLRAYEWADFGWGGLRALRWTARERTDGYCFLYPRRQDGSEDEGVEVYLALETGCMERLLADEELARWAEVRN